MARIGLLVSHQRTARFQRNAYANRLIRGRPCHPWFKSLKDNTGNHGFHEYHGLTSYPHQRTTRFQRGTHLNRLYPWPSVPSVVQVFKRQYRKPRISRISRIGLLSSSAHHMFAARYASQSSLSVDTRAVVQIFKRRYAKPGFSRKPRTEL